MNIFSNELKDLVRKLVQEELEEQKRLAQKEEIDIHQVSQITGLAVGTIYIYKSRNEIPYHKRGKRLVFLRSEIEAWNNNRLSSSLEEKKIKFDKSMSDQKKWLLGK